MTPHKISESIPGMNGMIANPQNPNAAAASVRSLKTTPANEQNVPKPKKNHSMEELFHVQSENSEKSCPVFASFRVLYRWKTKLPDTLVDFPRAK
jgi:hypothetical protein